VLELPQLLRRKLFFQGRKFAYEVNRYRLPNKVEAEMECIRHPGGALVVPVLPSGELVLLRQYRFTVQRRILEFPAGTIEPGETGLSTAEREVQEESGYLAETLKHMGDILLAPGYSDESVGIYLATGLSKMESPPDQDEDEDIEVLTMTPEAIEEAILLGDIIDSKTISAFMMVRHLIMS
jgi:ADP-ribose pyrophosphatase